MIRPVGITLSAADCEGQGFPTHHVPAAPPSGQARWLRGDGSVNADVLALGDAAVAVAGDEHDAGDGGQNCGGDERCDENEHGETFRHGMEVNARAVAWLLYLKYTAGNRAEQANVSVLTL